MELGIVGLPRSGKTSLFNAVTRGGAEVGAYSSRQEPNIGVVRVPDPRLDALSALFKPRKTTPAEIRWVDFPALELGTQGTPPSPQLLASLAGLDALVHVARVFEDPAVPHTEGSVDARRDIETLELELTYADLALIERRLERIESELRSMKAGERAVMERDRALLQRLQAGLEAGTAIRALSLSDEERGQLAAYQFVTRRPELLVINVGEDDLGRSDEIAAEFGDGSTGVEVGRAVVALCAKLEAELATLDEAEAAEFRSELGLTGPSLLDQAIRAAYELLGVHSFLTVGEDECRAWTVRQGATAPEAAGAIHSDLERGFIRAEVCNWEDLVQAGSIAALRKEGKLRTEGRDYVVRDGDVLNILFNV